MIKLLLSLFIIIIIISNIYSQNDSTYFTQKCNDKNEVTTSYYKNGKLIKIINTFNGIRNGITETYIDDTTSNEYLRIRYVFNEGILETKRSYARDSTLLNEFIYEKGKLISNKILVNIDNKGKHYVQKKYFYNDCFKQYFYINDIVVDSLSFSPPK